MDELTSLALAARDGDERALTRFVARSQGEVWRLSAHLVDRQSADDLTQETFLRAVRALPRFRGDASARTWLLVIARRTCIDEIRSRTRRRRLHRPASQEEVARIPDAAAPGFGVELTDLLAPLDPDRATAFVLTQVLGLSYSEAAEVCACPVGTIRSRVARARADLVGLLGEGEAGAEADVASF